MGGAPEVFFGARKHHLLNPARPVFVFVFAGASLDVLSL